MSIINQKKINQNLKIKCSELEKQEKIISKKNEELKSLLEHKEKELKNIIKNYIPENYGPKFQSDSRTGE